MSSAFTHLINERVFQSNAQSEMSLIAGGLVGDNNMAALFFVWKANMTAVTTRENTLAHNKNCYPFNLKMSVERSKRRCFLTLIL